MNIKNLPNPANSKVLIINTLCLDLSLKKLNNYYLENFQLCLPTLEVIIKDLEINQCIIAVSEDTDMEIKNIKLPDQASFQVFSQIGEVSLKEDSTVLDISTLFNLNLDSFLVSIMGTVNSPGLYDLPKDTPLLELVYHYGKGLTLPHKEFKAISWGGTMGSLHHKKHLALTLKSPNITESLELPNSFMIFNDTTCIVSLVNTFTLYNKTKLANCNLCKACNNHLTPVLDTLEKIVLGKAKHEDIQLLHDFCLRQAKEALCVLGRKALLPLASALENFQEEFQEHIQGYCRSSACEELFLASCVNACPAGVDLPGTIGLMQKGHYQDAVALGWEANPFFLSCGRICEEPPCQKYCQRQTIDTPINSRALHKYAGEKALANAGDLKNLLDHRAFKVPQSTGKKVAIVGAGPAGLTAAYFLALMGHKITVFEQHNVSGGMLRLGIPKYRLTRDILDGEISHILSLGVEIKYNMELGTDITLKELQKDYDAVFIALGAHNSNSLNIIGESLPGVLSGIEFLAKVNLEESVSMGEKVVVVGGGNVAIDAARCALRSGALDIKIVYRRNISDMPAALEEIEALIAEGIEVIPMVNPVEAMGQGKIEKVKLQVMEPGSYDHSGRKKPVKTADFIELPVDNLIIAVGQSPNLEGIKDAEIKTDWDNIKVNHQTFTSSLEGVFAGGDCVTGPATAVLAVSHGKKAAKAIHQFLLPGAIATLPNLRSLLKNYIGPSTSEPREQQKPTHSQIAERIKSFIEVEKSYSDYQALQEMERCICSAKTGL